MKTCNLSTVKNTPNEVRRDASTLDYLFIDYPVKYQDLDEYHYSSMREIIESIYSVLADTFLSSLDGASIKAVYRDGTTTVVCKIVVDATSHNIIFKRK